LDAVFGCLLRIPSGARARRVYGAASQLPGANRPRFTLLGGQRLRFYSHKKKGLSPLFLLYI
ncbi:MAG: hypothetical protein L3J28_03000, partial [Candidatus Polarisedimenticolaceae bacterium]|nr:hypothetical protein [Candidatus Polarisedimenticolaceae bacterium]